MAHRPGTSAIVAVAIGIVACHPARAGSTPRRCDDEALNRWLSLCALLHPTVEPDYSRPSHAKWPIGNDARFELHGVSSAAFVESCQRLLAQRTDWPEGLAAARERWVQAAWLCSEGEQVAWLRQCLEEALALPGLTRSELLSNFRTEGGIWTPSGRIFVHRRCGHLKVRVAFFLASPDLRIESPNDRIEAAEPYVGLHIVD